MLDRLGWVGEGLAFSQRDTSASQFSMDKAALDVIATVAAGNQLAILVKTLDALKKLGEGDRSLRIFDLQAMQELSGNFQIGAAQQAENGATSMALGASISTPRTTGANSCSSAGAPRPSNSGPPSAR